MRRSRSDHNRAMVTARRPRIGIVTPATAGQNNGNWRTAQRWARMLSPWAATRILQDWDGAPFDLLIALHARRSAASIARWSASGAGPLAVVLTGTDLYGDIHTDAAARRSLALADALVVLQDQAPAALPARWRAKAAVIYQSARARPPAEKTGRRLRAIAVGHLREVKDPATLLDCAQALRGRSDIRIDQVGAALDAGLARRARSTMARCPGYRWLGPLGHGETLRRIRAAHVLVQMSRAEGGAHTIAEAVRMGTPVLASRVPGNVGMLGERYPGYFPVGDAGALARAIERCRDEPDFLAQLARQCAARAARFDPERERRTLLAVARRLLAARR